MKKIYLFAFYLFAIPFSTIGQVFDFEGNRYDTVQIGNQVWLKQNARSKKYSDGKEVDVNNYKCPNGDCSKKDSFGLLYNYKGLSHGETGRILNGICPKGYAIPTPQNWHELMLYLNADTTWLWKSAYNDVKSKIIDKAWGGTGETDLSILPAGVYSKDNFANFGSATDIMLVESENHKSVFMTFDGNLTGTVNVFDFMPPELAKVDYNYESCRCIKSEISTSSKNLEKSFNWKIYPNPCRESFSIFSNTDIEIKTVEIISINGQKVKLTQNDKGMFVINKPSGIYFIKISDYLKTEYIKLIVL